MKRAPAKPDFDRGGTPRAAWDWASWLIPYVRQAFTPEQPQPLNAHYWQYGYVKG